MKKEQEPKYFATAHRPYGEGYLVNRESGLQIPDDEPVFIFRARDKHAIKALSAYYAELSNADHMAAVLERIEHFRRFAASYPEKMKEPDTQRNK